MQSYPTLSDNGAEGVFGFVKRKPVGELQMKISAEKLKVSDLNERYRFKEELL